MYMLLTNADGCLFGNYYAEPLTGKQANALLKIVRKVDKGARMVQVVEKIPQKKAKRKG